MTTKKVWVDLTTVFEPQHSLFTEVFMEKQRIAKSWEQDNEHRTGQSYRVIIEVESSKLSELKTILNQKNVYRLYGVISFGNVGKKATDDSKSSLEKSNGN